MLKARDVRVILRDKGDKAIPHLFEVLATDISTTNHQLRELAVHIDKLTSLLQDMQTVMNITTKQVTKLSTTRAIDRLGEQDHN